MNVAFLRTNARGYCREDFYAQRGCPRWIHAVRRVLQDRGVLPRGQS